jgi:phospholipid/cholesterol/gamma-HCH transport system ATP-binding protein
VFFEGENFTEMDFTERVPIRTQIGMLFQNSALFDSMTVEENIMFPLNLFTNKQSRKTGTRQFLPGKRVNLKDKNKLYPSELSGGMKKRVGIARAISMQPKYLFVDEPNSGLDPKTSILIDELIDELTEEYQMTTVIVTHDMNSVMGIGDHIIFLHQGQKWWEGSKQRNCPYR